MESTSTPDWTALPISPCPGRIVSTEFVRYRWYPDVVWHRYFHDHVSALTSCRIAEPGSTYHDPHSGVDVKSGPVVDVHTDARVSTDVVGSFRELVLFIQDDNTLAKVGDSSGSTFNLRAEPLAARGGDPSRLFSSQVHGDPETPILESFLGDPILVRGLVGGANDVHTLHIDGHWFRAEPFGDTSPPINTVHIGISERYDLVIPRAGGPQGQPAPRANRATISTTVAGPSNSGKAVGESYGFTMAQPTRPSENCPAMRRSLNRRPPSARPALRRRSLPSPLSRLPYLCWAGTSASSTFCRKSERRFYPAPKFPSLWSYASTLGTA